MAIQKILTIPNQILKNKSLLITNIDNNVRKTALDLIETMHSHKNCVGIAAPQIGINIRMIAVNAGLYPKECPHHGELVLVNPVLKLSADRNIGREGCLSIPEFTANVARSVNIEVDALNLEGNIIKLMTSGFEAVVIQHEVDHLDGILFLDKVSSLKTDIFRRKQMRP